MHQFTVLLVLAAFFACSSALVTEGTAQEVNSLASARDQTFKIRNRTQLGN
jgi:hypothetical protein